MKRETCPLFFLLLLAVPASARQGRPGPEPPPRDEGCVVQFVPRVTCPGDSASFLGIVDQPPEGKKGLYVRSHGQIVIVQAAPIGDGGLILPDRKAVKKPVRLWCAIMDAGVADNMAKKIVSLLKKREGQLTKQHRKTREQVMKFEDRIDFARRMFAARFKKTIAVQDALVRTGEVANNDDLIVSARTNARLTTELQLQALTNRIEAFLALIDLYEALDDTIVFQMETIDLAIDTLIALGTPNHTDRLNVAEVESVRLEAIDATLSVNPNIRGGMRIFPDPVTPNGVEHPDVRVVARVRPKVSGLKIFFKTVDPDDPYTDRDPLDANASLANDNVVLQGDGPPEGAFKESHAPTVERVTNGAGEADATLQVNFQPGNNFQVLASCHEGDVIPLDGTAVSANLSPYRLTSDMLTVWRRFHVEADSMDAITNAPDGNRVSGKITAVLAAKFKKRNVVQVDTDVNLDDSANRFEYGKMVSGGKEYDVIGNLTGANISVYLNPKGGQPNVGAAFELYDDDFKGVVDRGLLPHLPLTDLMGVFYGDAYLSVEVDGGGNTSWNTQDLVPQVNLQGIGGQWDSVDGTQDKPGIQSHQNRGDRFWIVYIQSAFQGSKAGDLDPDKENAALAETEYGRPQTATTRPIGASIIYRETIRDAGSSMLPGDLLLMEQRIVVHETAHQFHILDELGQGGVMDSVTIVALPPDDLGFRDSHLRTIRVRRNSPGLP